MTRRGQQWRPDRDGPGGCALPTFVVVILVTALVVIWALLARMPQS